MTKKFIAKIIDNDDSEQKGRVQIFIDHLMENWEKDHYPWAFPCNSFSSHIPEIGDYYWVWFEDKQNFKKPFYTHKVQFHDSNDANKTIGSLEGSYPDIKYIWFENGVAIAMNSNQAELSITNGTSEIYVNNNNDIIIGNGTAEVKLEANGTITIKTGDASPWKPCIIGSCIYSGAPHGGTVAGITKLKGE